MVTEYCCCVILKLQCGSGYYGYSILLQKLDALEKEEELREAAGFYADDESEEDEEMMEIREKASR